jgi:hypothetical protein
MDFFLYFFLSTWQSYLSVFLIVFGIYLFRLPYLIQPVHSFKFRSIFAALLIISGITGIFCGFLMSQHELNDGQYQELKITAKADKRAEFFLKERQKHHKTITQMDYFHLKRNLEADQKASTKK